MEELSARFPHIGEKILLSLDFQSLINCKEVNRHWKEIMESQNPCYLRIIKHYTECSDKMLKNVLKKSGAAIVLVSILYEIFRKFRRGTKQRNRYLKNWDTTPLHEAAKNGHVAVYQLIMDEVKDKNPYFHRHFVHSSDVIVNCRKERIIRPLSVVVVSGDITPLHLAAAKGQLKLFKVIYQNIKSVLPLDMNGHTPHYYALKYNQVEVVRYIHKILSYKHHPYKHQY